MIAVPSSKSNRSGYAIEPFGHFRAGNVEPYVVPTNTRLTTDSRRYALAEFGVCFHRYFPAKDVAATLPPSRTGDRGTTVVPIPVDGVPDSAA